MQSCFNSATNQFINFGNWIYLQIEMIFKDKNCSEIRDSAFGLTKRLAQTIQET